MSSTELVQDDIPTPGRLITPLIFAVIAVFALQMGLVYLSVLQLDTQTRSMEQQAAKGLASALADDDLAEMTIAFEAAGFENAQIVSHPGEHDMWVEIVSSQGLRRGYIAFSPEEPGRKVFEQTAPYKASLIGVCMLIVIGVLLRLRQQTRLIEAKRQRAREMALTDGLSGLANRTYFNVRLDAELTKLAAGGNVVALYFIDIDHFKRVNDTYGHAKGDALIVQLAHALNAFAGRDNFVARLAGDEFAIIRTGVGDSLAAQAFGNELVRSIDREYLLGDTPVAMRISVGVALAERYQHVERATLCNNADMALYSAKRVGRNQAVLFGEVVDYGTQNRKSA